MIAAIAGEVFKKEPTCIQILTAGGVVYEIFVSLNCSSSITKSEVMLHTTHVVREDAQLLFGFLNLDEKRMFDTLIKINGVGPKVALAVCSTFTPDKFMSIVRGQNVAMLKRVPGIGPKSANRILVELGDFSLENTHAQESSLALTQAALALESLGFKKDIASKALLECSSTQTEELIKEALKRLSKAASR